MTVESDVTLTLDNVTVSGTTITDNASVALDDTVKLTGGAIIQGGAITNNGTLEVAGAATLLNDTLTNTSATGSIIQIDDDQTLTLSGTEIIGGIINDNGTIDVTGDSTIDGNASLNNGNVTVESDVTLTLDNVTVSGATITDNASIALDDTVKLTGGAIIQGGAITNNGTLEVAGPATLLNDTLTNTSATGSIIQIDNGDTLTLNGTAINGGTVNDNGAIHVAGSSKIAGASLNNGGVTVDSGQTLKLDNVKVTGTTFTDPGTIKVESGKTLRFLAGTDKINGGQFAFGGGQAQAAGNGVLLTGASIGNLNAGNPVLTLTITASSGSIVPVSTSGLTVVGGLDGSNGTIEVTGTLADINAALNSGLTYNPVGTSNTLTMSVDDGAGDTAFRTLTVDTSGASPNVQLSDASGAIKIASGGLLDITGTTTLSSDEVFNGAALKVEANALLKLIHSGTHGGTITDNGTIEIAAHSGINGGNLNIDINGHLIVDSGKLLTLNNSTVTGGTITDNGAIEITNSSAINGASLNNGGVTIDSGQTLKLNNDTVTGTTITGTDATSIIQIDGNTTLKLNGAIINGGTLSISGTLDAADTSTISDVAITNTGLIEATNGILTIDPALLVAITNFGTLEANGGELDITNEPVTDTGTLQAINDSTLKLTTTVVTNVDGTVSVGSGSTLDLMGAIITGGTLSISGTLNSTGISAIDGATINNAGTLEMTGGTLTIDAASTVNNTGVIEVNGGNLVVDTTFAGSAEIIGASLLELGANSSGAYSSANIAFAAGATGILKLDHAEAFSGTVSGLDDNKLDLGDITSGADTSIIYSGDSAGGILTIVSKADPTQVAHIQLTGDYLGSSFTAASDGHGGTSVTEVPGVIAGLDSHGDAVEGNAVAVSITDGGQPVTNATYQWQLDGHDILNAAYASYVPTENDEGHALTVNISFVDPLNHLETGTLNAGTVEDRAPVITGTSGSASSTGVGLGANLVTNGGFETGNFSGWTQSGNTGFTVVFSSGSHGGTYNAWLGPVGSTVISPRISQLWRGSITRLIFGYRMMAVFRTISALVGTAQHFLRSL